MTDPGPHSGRRRAHVWGLGLLVAAAACATFEWEPLGPRRTAPIPDAQAVGAAECAVCHTDVQGHREIASYHQDCEDCHGGGQRHSRTEAWEDIRFPAAEDCLACHADDRTHLQWATAPHARAGLLCSDCHNPHAPSRRHLRSSAVRASWNMDPASRLCVECHREVAARLTYPSHHPVREGAMGCLDCHDPHADPRARHGERTERCATCHQDVMGPWIFEHPPAVEDCTLCHDPHGAVTDALLETLQPTICLSCHSQADSAHHDVLASGILGNRTISQDHPTDPAEQISTREARTFQNRCTDCHGAVHGSYTDEHLRH